MHGSNINRVCYIWRTISSEKIDKSSTKMVMPCDVIALPCIWITGCYLFYIFSIRFFLSLSVAFCWEDSDSNMNYTQINQNRVLYGAKTGHECSQTDVLHNIPCECRSLPVHVYRFYWRQWYAFYFIRIINGQYLPFCFGFTGKIQSVILQDIITVPPVNK
jgi:hypothetical protein